MRGGLRGGKSFQRARGTAGRVQVRSYGRRATRGNLAVNSNTNTNDKEVIDKESERKIVKRHVNPLDEYGNPQTCHICDETLALQLMESAGLRDELSQLVITGIDEEREDVFDQTKRAMRKYLGSERAGISAKGMQELIFTDR